MLHQFKATIKREFEMIKLGIIKYLLGIEVKKSTQGIFMLAKSFYT